MRGVPNTKMTWADLKIQHRLAGMVKRYHTHPTLTNPTVADHVYNLMRVWWLLWGPMPTHISTHLLWHDSGELVASDVCHHTKNQMPDLRAMLARIEAEAVMQMGGPGEVEMTETDIRRAKMCDLIEMFEFAIIEIAFGNQFAHTIVNSCHTAIWKVLHKMSVTDGRKVHLYIEEMYKAADTYGITIAPFQDPDEE